MPIFKDFRILCFEINSTIDVSWCVLSKRINSQSILKLIFALKHFTQPNVLLPSENGSILVPS